MAHDQSFQEIFWLRRLVLTSPGDRRWQQLSGVGLFCPWPLLLPYVALSSEPSVTVDFWFQETEDNEVLLSCLLEYSCLTFPGDNVPKEEVRHYSLGSSWQRRGWSFWQLCSGNHGPSLSSGLLGLVSLSFNHAWFGLWKTIEDEVTSMESSWNFFLLPIPGDNVLWEKVGLHTIWEWRTAQCTSSLNDADGVADFSWRMLGAPVIDKILPSYATALLPSQSSRFHKNPVLLNCQCRLRRTGCSSCCLMGESSAMCHECLCPYILFLYFSLFFFSSLISINFYFQGGTGNSAESFSQFQWRRFWCKTFIGEHQRRLVSGQGHVLPMPRVVILPHLRGGLGHYTAHLRTTGIRNSDEAQVSINLRNLEPFSPVVGGSPTAVPEKEGRSPPR